MKLNGFWLIDKKNNGKSQFYQLKLNTYIFGMPYITYQFSYSFIVGVINNSILIRTLIIIKITTTLRKNAKQKKNKRRRQC